MGGAHSSSRGGTHSSHCASSHALQAKYVTLSAAFATSGFDEAALSKGSLSFIDGRPRRYAEPPWSLPPDAVRVLALPLDDSALTDAPGRRVGALALQAAEEVSSLLPRGAKTWLPSAGRLHVTVFHPGVYPPSLGDGSQLQRQSVDAHRLRREVDAARKIVASVPVNLSLVVDRLVMTPSGVLLLLLRPEHDGESACVESLRAACTSAFPGAARKQTSGLLHVSLLRTLSLPRNPWSPPYGANSSLARGVSSLVDRWSARLRGERAGIGGLLYVRESQIMTLEGEVHRLRFGSGGWSPRRLAGGRRAAARARMLAADGARAGFEPRDAKAPADASHERAWAEAPFLRIGIEDDNTAP